MTKIALKESFSHKDNIIVFGDSRDSFSKYGITDREFSFIKDEIKNEKKLITINQYDRLILVCIPEIKSTPYLTLESFRKAGNKADAILNSAKAKEVVIIDNKEKPEQVLAFAEGMMLGNYQFLNFINEKDKKENSLNSIIIRSDGISADDFRNLQIITEATLKARDLVNLPLNYLNALQLSKKFEKMGEEAGFKVEVFNKSKIEALKMGGLLAVNRGSVDPPTFTIMEWKPKKTVNKKPYLLVGKGVVYDTGGLSLKPTLNSMDSMKCDMAGAAAVGCTMYAVAKAKLPLHVIGLAPATDNRPGMNAYVPGDVIVMHNGTTVEMLNADAEGRMILADALSFGARFKPALAIELSTLTGAAAGAIGKYGIVAMSTANDTVFNELKKSGEKVNERLVEFPLWEEYGDLLKTEVADIKNIGGAVGGAITAGKFLEKFVSFPFIHLDIAGPAFIDGNYDYKTKGGTGVGVRLLFEFFKNIQQKQ